RCARAIQTAIEQVRIKATPTAQQRFTLVLCGPRAAQPRLLRAPMAMFLDFVKEKGFANDVLVIEGEGFVGFDGASDQNEQQLLGYVQQFISERLQAAEFHPDAWPPVIIHNPQETQAKLSAVAGDKYSYRQMDDFTDLIEKTLKT